MSCRFVAFNTVKSALIWPNFTDDDPNDDVFNYYYRSVNCLQQNIIISSNCLSRWKVTFQTHDTHISLNPIWSHVVKWAENDNRIESIPWKLISLKLCYRNRAVVSMKNGHHRRRLIKHSKVNFLRLHRHVTVNRQPWAQIITTAAAVTAISRSEYPQTVNQIKIAFISWTCYWFHNKLPFTMHQFWLIWW